MRKAKPMPIMTGRSERRSVFKSRKTSSYLQKQKLISITRKAVITIFFTVFADT